MKKVLCIMLIVLVSFPCFSPAMAQVGVTDACQDTVKELEDKIRDNRDDYTAESRRKAKQHLMKARANRLNPAKCRSSVLEAREELRKGRRDRRDNDRDRDKIRDRD